MTASILSSFSPTRSPLLRWLAALSVVAGSLVVLSAPWRVGTGPNLKVEPALLLSFEEVTPASVACNASAVLDREGVLLAAISASHCSDRSRAIAVGGDDLCDPGQWEVINLEGWRSIGTDLSVAIGKTAGSRASPPPLFTTDVVVDPSLDAEVVGFGRAGGSGSLTCERQSVDNRTLGHHECPVDVEETNDICLQGGVFCAGWSGAGVYVDQTFRGVLVGGSTCRVGPEGAVLARTVVVSEADERPGATSADGD